MNTTTCDKAPVQIGSTVETPTWAILTPAPGTKRTAQAVRANLAGQVIQFAIDSGVTAEDAAKLAAIFDGKRALCAPMTPKIHVAHVNGVCFEQGILFNEVSGYLTVDLADSGPTQIQLREDADQNMFLIGVERLGSAPTDGGEATNFISYHLVICETEGDMPLVIGMNAVNDGESISLKWSRRLYLKQITHPVTRETSWQNRLETLDGLQNMEGVCFRVALQAQFGIMETRVNASPARQRNTNNRGNQNQPANSNSYNEAAVSGRDPWND